MKKGLEKNQIPYKHIYLENYVDLLSCYHALDLYLITSREEGGPMGLMESMSSGVAVVSTPVGMAPDLIIDGLNGGLAESIQAEMLVSKVFNVIKKVQTGFDMAQAAKTSVEVCAWDKVAEDHLRIYSPLVDAVHSKIMNKQHDVFIKKVLRQSYRMYLGIKTSLIIQFQEPQE